MALRWVACAVPVLLGLAVCQQRTDLPSFEVASVKPAAPGPPGLFLGSSTKSDPGRISYTNTLLATLIALAYNVEYYQVSGAPWLQSERYDVIAKLPDNAATKDTPLMLQRLLQERFHFAYHTLTKEVMMHVIVADKGGPKLDEVAEEELNAKGFPQRHGIMISGGRITTGRVTVSDLASFFSHMVEEPVVDLTNVSARFKVDAPFRIEMDGAGAAQPGSEATASTGLAAKPNFYPGIVATLTRLGLRLERRKAPLTFIVVDHADRIPVAN